VLYSSLCTHTFYTVNGLLYHRRNRAANCKYHTMSSLLRSTAAGCNIIRRLQVISAPSSASRALNCYVQSTLGNRFTTIRALSSKETVTITYCDPDGTEHPVEAEIGKHLLDVAHDNNIELEGKFCLVSSRSISIARRELYLMGISICQRHNNE
jgi:hypothetical protein